MDERTQEDATLPERPRSHPADVTAPPKTPETQRKTGQPDPQSPASFDGNPTSPAAAAPARSKRAVNLIVPTLRKIATAALALIAGAISIVIWDYYVTSPWTRDGRVRVQVASVAPEVSGRIKELQIIDNQFVHKGDVLYVIDPFDFEVSLRTDVAVLEQRTADWNVKRLQSERRQQLSDYSVTTEERQIFVGGATQARAAMDAAQEQVAEAELNLKRTEVRSPVNGYVTNLLLREGDYAHLGVSNVSIIDTESYWIDGYFEETKLGRLCVGDRAEAKLMGYSVPITGHVATVTRGVSVSDATAGAQGLPNVDPVYTWVRLAQRVPVRIAIDKVPSGLPLVSGMTATVTIRKDPREEQRTWLERVREQVPMSVSDLVSGLPVKPGCLPPSLPDAGRR